MWAKPYLLLNAGMALLGYLLQRCNPVHLNAPLLHALESLLKAVAPSEALTQQLLQQLLLNLRLWSCAPPAGQHSLKDLILKLAKVGLTCSYLWYPHCFCSGSVCRFILCPQCCQIANVASFVLRRWLYQ